MVNKTFWYVYIFIILIVVGGIFITYQKDRVVDEPSHFAQIDNFTHQRYVMSADLTVIPGYHAIIASIMLLFGTLTLDAARIITTLFLVLTLIPAFFVLTDKSWRKTLQLFFFPLMFLFYFILYTDLTSVLFIALASICLFQKKYTWSGVFFIISILIRQNNFIWLAYGVVYIMFDEWIDSGVWKINKDFIFKMFKRLWMYGIGLVLFGAFVILNKGIVIGDRGSHPMGIYSTNIYFFLFMTFFMFLPSILLKIKDIFEWIITHRVLAMSIMIITPLLTLFQMTNNHWYNNSIAGGSVIDSGILHNILMVWAVGSTTSRLLFAIPVILGLLYFIVSKLKDPIYYLVYPFSVMIMAASEMVDPRYYFIPFGLFIAFREEGSEREEYYLLGYFILLGIAMYIGIMRHALIW